MACRAFVEHKKKQKKMWKTNAEMNKKQKHHKQQMHKKQEFSMTNPVERKQCKDESPFRRTATGLHSQPLAQVFRIVAALRSFLIFSVLAFIGHYSRLAFPAIGLSFSLCSNFAELSNLQLFSFYWPFAAVLESLWRNDTGLITCSFT